METSPVVAGGGGFVVIVGFLVTVGSTVVVVSEIYKITIRYLFQEWPISAV